MKRDTWDRETVLYSLWKIVRPIRSLVKAIPEDDYADDTDEQLQMWEDVQMACENGLAQIGTLVREHVHAHDAAIFEDAEAILALMAGALTAIGCGQRYNDSGVSLLAIRGSVALYIEKLSNQVTAAIDGIGQNTPSATLAKEAA